MFAKKNMKIREKIKSKVDSLSDAELRYLDRLLGALGKNKPLKKTGHVHESDPPYDRIKAMMPPNGLTSKEIEEQRNDRV